MESHSFLLVLISRKPCSMDLLLTSSLSGKPPQPDPEQKGLSFLQILALPLGGCVTSRPDKPADASLLTCEVSTLLFTYQMLTQDAMHSLRPLSMATSWRGVHIPSI